MFDDERVVSEIVGQVAEMAEQDADRLVAFMKSGGMLPLPSGVEPPSLAGLLNFAVRSRLGEYDAAGLLRHQPFEAPLHGEVHRLLESGACPADPALALAVSLSSDMLSYQLAHVIIPKALQRFTGKNGVDVGPETSLFPTQAMKACFQDWGRPIAMAFAPSNPSSGMGRKGKRRRSVKSVEELLKQATWTEEEAGLVLHYSAKRLADLRRDGVIPREVYRQPVRNGSVKYINELVMAWLKQQPGIVQPNSGSRKPRKTQRRK